jgi:hypothetical protein
MNTISLQASLSDLQKVVSTNDATVTGVLIAFCIAFSLCIIYLFKTIQDLNKDHMNELRTFNDLLLKANDKVYEIIKIMNEFKNK